MFKRIIKRLYLIISRIYISIPNKKYIVLSILETLDFIINKEASIIRFGDGDIHLYNGFDMPYQKFDKRLVESFDEIVENKNSN